MGLSPEAVGTKLDTIERSWGSKDCLLYAVSVGAGALDPATELEFTTENSHKVQQRALPTFGVLAAGCGGEVEVQALHALQLEADVVVRGVHGAQEIELFEEIPVEGRARIEPVITAVEAKATGTTMTIEAKAYRAEDDAPLFTARSTMFFRGVGSDPEAKGRKADDVLEPDGAPTHSVTYNVRPEQGLLYRLNGDRNPLHSDPKFAKMAGFGAPILHGLCTYGFAGRALVQTACDGNPGRLAAMFGRFTKPVLPGDDLTVSVWEGDEIAYRVQTQRGDTVLAGWCRLR
ncbi:MAG TPA: MaoC/PaaZ C-terminal domain-containing protein [Acidimicrobiales bacterium]|nr:MaoC/PaaZ C-terminal domain-containing protein [Acidimicrobiales bacterium]